MLCDFDLEKTTLLERKTTFESVRECQPVLREQQRQSSTTAERVKGRIEHTYTLEPVPTAYPALHVRCKKGHSMGHRSDNPATYKNLAARMPTAIPTSRNKKLVVTSATLVVTGALLVVTRSY